MLLSEGQDRPLGAVERASLEAHLRLCQGCQNFRKQIGFLRQALRRHPALRQPDDED